MTARLLVLYRARYLFCFTLSLLLQCRFSAVCLCARRTTSCTGSSTASACRPGFRWSTSPSSSGGSRATCVPSTSCWTGPASTSAGDASAGSPASMRPWACTWLPRRSTWVSSGQRSSSSQAWQAALSTTTPTGRNWRSADRTGSVASGAVIRRWFGRSISYPTARRGPACSWCPGTGAWRVTSTTCPSCRWPSSGRSPRCSNTWCRTPTCCGCLCCLYIARSETTPNAGRSTANTGKSIVGECPTKWFPMSSRRCTVHSYYFELSSDRTDKSCNKLDSVVVGKKGGGAKSCNF